ncbi:MULTISPECIES: S8 family peptidase [Paenibacillus]|uniref:S8 family peptidase n=1 Tax=Paenibacillus TaxID=44249 RepID=UPI00204163E7|nr:S8 family peptidase [Paenibacillus camelliae]MCM3635500.1 S8 family peptidase [Paenibacillus camelliae]
MNSKKYDDAIIQLHTSATRKLVNNGIPWGVDKIKAPQAWTFSTGRNIKIGVIDTGIDYHHPALRGSILPGINLVESNRPPVDDNGHGTHIAGTIAAANAAHGMIGVAPHALIAPVKAFDQYGSAYVSDIVQAIDWCVRNKMNIINMSFGMRTKSRSMLNAVNRAYQKGVIIIASSGNDSKRKSIDYPARYLHTVAVGATNANRKVAPFSNRGEYIDIYAPGDRIVSAWLNNEYHEMNGTSMATSHVSGAVALLLELYPQLRPGDIKAVLKRSMQPLKYTKSRKAGELDVMKMLNAAKELYG